MTKARSVMLRAFANGRSRIGPVYLPFLSHLLHLPATILPPQLGHFPFFAFPFGIDRFTPPLPS